MTILRFALLLFPLAALAKDPAPAKGATGWEAFSAIQTGNMRFYEGRPSHPNQDPARRELVAGGQHPHTILISCSDSRVPPETIFDQGLGELFVVRLAGNVMTTEAIASVEYAIEHLGAKLLIVMGHESCGAVGAAVAAKSGTSNGSESLDVLVKQIRANLTGPAIEQGTTDKTFRLGVKENVSASLRALIQRSAIVRRAITKNELVVGQAIYSLKSGRVEFWDVGKGLEAAENTDKPVLRETKITEEVIPSDSLKTDSPKKEKKKPKEAPVTAH